MLTFLLDNWLLIAAALISGGLLLWPLISRGSQAGSVSPAEAVRLMNREKGIVIDVNEAAEYAAGHVAGARSVPMSSLEGSKELPSNKKLPLIVVCASGSRAAKAAALLRNKLGYENAASLAGGLAAWREANLPIEASKA